MWPYLGLLCGRLKLCVRGHLGHYLSVYLVYLSNVIAIARVSASEATATTQTQYVSGILDVQQYLVKDESTLVLTSVFSLLVLCHSTSLCLRTSTVFSPIFFSSTGHRGHIGRSQAIHLGLFYILQVAPPSPPVPNSR